MSDTKLTSFQQAAEREIVALLERSGRRLDRREVMSGTIPFESKDPQTAVRLCSNDCDVWLFGDEANVAIGGREDRLERADFDSTEALLAELLRRLGAGLRTG